MENLYVVVSATPAKIGKMIRFVTRAPMNHVAVARKEDLSDLVSFARRFYRTPLYGGFVRESVERYTDGKFFSPVRVYAIPLDDNQAERVDRRIGEMSADPERYLYNLADAALVPFRRRADRVDAYTCLGFVCLLLRDAGIFSGEPVYGIMDLGKLLAQYRVYEGTMDHFALPENPDYRKRISFLEGTRLTLRQIRELRRR